MKIYTIFPITGSTEMISRLLDKGVSNDYLFEKCGFYMEVEPTNGIDGWLDFLYRRLWETTYIRRDGNDNVSYYDNKIRKVMLFITLNEAIGFIKHITPPILRPRIPEALKDVDSIHEVLKEYLIEGTPNQPPHVKTEFQKYIGFNKFETSSSYHIQRMNLLRKLTPDGVVIDIEAHNAPSEKLLCCNASPKDKYEVQLMLHAKNESDLHKICYELGIGLDCFKVINVFFVKYNGYFVELYIPEYSFNKYESLGTLINRSYSKILTK